MINVMEKLLSIFHVHKRHVEEDKLQLDAAQDRLHERSSDLDRSVDELSKMIRRIKRGRS